MSTVENHAENHVENHSAPPNGREPDLIHFKTTLRWRVSSDELLVDKRAALCYSMFSILNMVQRHKRPCRAILSASLELFLSQFPHPAEYQFGEPWSFVHKKNT